jgi:rhodanese-related sulfurtransferase
VKEELAHPVRTINDLLADARRHLRRLTPLEAYCACADGAHLVDIRSRRLRREHGVILGAHYIHRNLLEWRLDPHSPDRDPRIAYHGSRVILFCQEGHQSSLAAAAVRQFGIDATDVIDGFAAWRAAGLPTLADSEATRQPALA